MSKFWQRQIRKNNSLSSDGVGPYKKPMHRGDRPCFFVGARLFKNRSNETNQ